MKKRNILFIIVITLLTVSSCQKSKINAVTSTPAIAGTVDSTTSTVLPTTDILPTATESVEISLTENSVVKPGIYLIYRKDDQIFALNSEGQKILLLTQIPSDTPVKASPDGLVFSYMDQGVLYVQNILDHKVKVVPLPSHSLETNWWLGGWSNDGKYLVYSIDMVYDVNQNPQLQEFPSIYISDLSNDTYSKVTISNTVETFPSWSPDNQWVVFASDSSKISKGNSFVGATDIFLMSTKCVSEIETCKGAFTKQLTFTGTTGDAVNPSWNPIGSNIGFIFVDGQTGDKDIYIVDINGQITNLTNTPNKYEDAFDWSPDGKKLVFRQYNPGIGTDLFIYDISNASLTKITDIPRTTEGMPFWSPDGSKIAFQQNTDDTNSGVIIYSIDDSSSRVLEGSSGIKFLSWATVFPEFLPGTILTISLSGQGLNIRNEASTDSPIVGKLESGDQIQIISQSLAQDGYSWWKIKSEKGEGWVIQLYSWYLP